VPGRGAAAPLAEVAASRVEGPPPHWHLVTYGLSELDAKESDRAEVSGWGFELTLRLVWGDDTPDWAVDLLTSLAAYVWETGHPFAPGHHLDLAGPLQLGSRTDLRAGLVVRDRPLGTLEGPYGSVEFLQLVGLTADELELCRAWSTRGVVGMLATGNPLLVTDLARRSILADPGVAAEIERRRRAEGSGLTELRVASLRWHRRRGRTVVEMGPGTAAALGPALRRELVGAGATFAVVGDTTRLRFAVADEPGLQVDADGPVVEVPLGAVEDLAALFDGRSGRGRLPDWPTLTWHVTQA
jgi:suppressor of fused-like protein